MAGGTRSGEEWWTAPAACSGPQGDGGRGAGGNECERQAGEPRGAGADRRGDVLGEPPGDDPDRGRKRGLQHDPSQSTGLVSRNGRWPVCTRRSTCSWVTNATTASAASGTGESATRASIGGEPEEGDGGEDQDELRRVLEVPVHVPHRGSRDAIGDRVAEQDARRREGQRHEPGQETPHPR